MKKAISLILALVIIVSMAVPAFAVESSEEYYTIKVEYSDNTGHKESLDVMIQNDNVFVDAKMLAERLGYTFEENGESAVIYNTDTSNRLPFGITQFKYNSTQVSHMLFNNMIDTYEAPFASVKNSEGSWIPFEYSLLLLNSGMMITDDAVLIDIPTKRIIDYFFDVAKNSTKYGFDAASWASLFKQFAGSMDSYDKKYGENLAMLICTESDKELKASIDKVGMLIDLLNEDGKLGQMLSSTSAMLDSQVGTLYKNCEDILQKIKNGNSPLVSYNILYQALEDALGRQTWFSNTGGNVLEVQKGISSAAGKAFTVLDVGTKVLEVVGYAQEFQNQDDFSLAALTYYLDTANNGLELHEKIKKSMVDYSNALSDDIGEYMTKRFTENVGQWIVDEIPMHEVLGIQAAGALFAWDIASNTIPFILKGLSGADNFELALYSMVFQGDTFLNYLSKRDSVFADAENITAEHMYELSQYYYIYLKSCYVTREAALASLANKSDSTKEKIQPLIDYQNSINTEIAQIMVELKRANKTNDGLVFGFLPSDNKDYLDKYDNSQLIQWISQFKMNVSSSEWKEFYINYVNEHGNIYDSFGHAMEIYKLVNINNDSIPELYINFGTTAGGDVICTYYDGKVVEQPMWNYGFSYMQGQNIFRDAGGHMDVYHDKIYSIENGQFVLLHEGNYGVADNSHVQFDSDGNPIYNYYWDGTEVSSETEYMNLLNEVYNAQQAITPFDGAEYDSETWRYVGNGLCNYEEIIEAINTY